MNSEISRIGRNPIVVFVFAGSLGGRVDRAQCIGWRSVHNMCLPVWAALPLRRCQYAVRGLVLCVPGPLLVVGLEYVLPTLWVLGGVPL